MAALGAMAILAPALGGKRWETVSAPDGWSWNLPFMVQRKGRRFRASGWTIEGSRPAGKAYYVATDGLDTNDGLSAEAPLRKLVTALNKADVVEVYIKAGAYGFTNGWSTLNLGKSVSIIATDGRAAVGLWAEGLSWTKQEAPNEHVYRASRTNVNKVADATIVDANGDISFLTTRASVEGVEAAAGSWYTDATFVYVRTADDRAPDANIRCFFSNVNTVAQCSGAVTVYCEKIDFQGGNLGAAFAVQTAAGPLIPTGYFNDCTFKNCNASSGFKSLGAITYLKDCQSAKNYNDGFNYHDNLGGIPYGVEINCVGRDNGSAGDADNGSSIHDAGSIVRLNGEYMRNVGRNVHDITNGTLSWNLGCNAHDSTSAVNDCNWAVGSGGADTAKMWLDRCYSSGSVTDLEEAAAATLLHKLLISGGVNIGTPGTY